MPNKKVFSTILLLLTILLTVLPFLVTFNEVLTKLIERFQLYTAIQEQLVPQEVKIVTVILSPLHLKLVPTYTGFIVNGTFLTVTWNCVGWQSLLLLGITLGVGFGGGMYTRKSKIEALAMGLLGTFIVNLLRMAVIIIIFSYLRPIYAYVYHDYLAAVVTVIWLFGFWWFCYRFVLISKDTAMPK